MTLPTLTDIKNWAHSLAAFLAAAGLALAVVVNVMHAFNTAVPTSYADTIGAISAGFIALSKGIDSWSYTSITKSGTTPTA